MISDVFRDLARDPYFLPLAAIFAVIFLARLVGERR
jgi:hypothetical protein